MLVLVLSLLLSKALAQRPNDVSLCDYYTQAYYGANDGDKQLQLVQRIVVLAFGGRPNGSSNYSLDLTGILNPGTFQGLGVDLRPWFDGSKESTNDNNRAVGVDWLNGGGLDPLYSYLNGTTPNLTLPSESNQHGLFGRFFVSFAQLFSCSVPIQPPTQAGFPDSTTLNVAYVHKFMSLNATDLGHFINQLSYATSSVGFSDADNRYLVEHLNTTFNVRCAPPVQLAPNGPWQLPSLCQDPSCPISGVNPDCQAYVNITSNGLAGSAVPSTATTSDANGASPLALGKGAIAGIAVGGAFALVLLAVGASMLVRRRRRRTRANEPRHEAPTSEYRATTTTLGYAEPMYAPELPSPEMKKSSPMAEMESPVQSPRGMGAYDGGMSPVEIGGGQESGRGEGLWGRG